MNNFVLKAKKTVKRIAAIGAAGVMIGATITAALAVSASLDNYPSPFIKDGALNSRIVIGANAAAVDTVGAADISNGLQADAITGGVTTVTTSSSEGESAKIEKAGDPLNFADQTEGNFGEEFGDVVDAGLTDSELPRILADGTYDENKGGNNNDVTYTQKITFSKTEGPQLTYDTDDDGNEKVGSYVKFPNNEEIYTYKLDFNTDVDYDTDTTANTKADFQGSVIEILGQKYTFTDAKTTANQITELDLQTGDTIVTLQKGSAQTYNIDGKDYSVEVISVTDPNAADQECLISVDGTTKAISEGDTEKFGDLRVGVIDVFPIHLEASEDACEITLGSKEIKLENGQEVEVNGETIDDSDVTITNSANGKLTSIQIVQSASDDIFLGSETDGNEWVDPVFGSFKISYSGSSVDTEEVKVKASSNDGEVIFTNKEGKLVDDIGVFKKSTATTARGVEADVAYLGDDNDAQLLVESDVDDADDVNDGVCVLAEVIGSDAGDDCKDDSGAGNGAETVADLGNQDGTASDGAEILSETFVKDGALTDLEGTLLFVVTSGQVPRVIEITDVDTTNDEFNFKDLTYDRTYSDVDACTTAACTASVDLSALAGQDDAFFALGSVGTITLSLYNTATNGGDNFVGIHAKNINLATNGDDNGADLVDETEYAETSGNNFITLGDVANGLDGETAEVDSHVYTTLFESSDIDDADNANIQVEFDTDANNDLIVDTYTVAGGVSTSGKLDENKDNSDDQYEMTEAGTLIHKDAGGDDRFVYMDAPKGEALNGDAYISEIAFQAATTSTATTGNKFTINPVVTSDKISDPTAFNLILVGGPCANPLVTQVASDITCDGWTMGAGEAIIKLVDNGNNVAMIVAGTNGADTQDAARIVSAHSDANFKGTEVTVKSGKVTVPTTTTQ